MGPVDVGQDSRRLRCAMALAGSLPELAVDHVSEHALRPSGPSAPPQYEPCLQPFAARSTSPHGGGSVLLCPLQSGGRGSLYGSEPRRRGADLLHLQNPFRPPPQLSDRHHGWVPARPSGRRSGAAVHAQDIARSKSSILHVHCLSLVLDEPVEIAPGLDLARFGPINGKPSEAS